ncbi:MAG: M20/M25/M40 family metallo-hydrolase [Bacillota bacterium]|nr:M20/M25/M40 family metallo-hydrolase [Bacillota bacterium]
MLWLTWAVPIAAIVVLVLVVLLRTLAFRPRPDTPSAVLPVDFDQQKAIDDLQCMIRCATVSSYDASAEDEGEFQKFLALLPDLFPEVHRVCSFEATGRRGLLYGWKGISDANPTVLMAHYDVVPVHAELWEKPPFAGIIESGELWGRGTLDTKATLNGILQAAETLIKQDFVPENDIWFAFGGNEEVEGQDAPATVALLDQRGIRPALVIDEGGAVVDNIFPGVHKPCAVIGTGEKGMMHFEMAAESIGGHASAPPPRSSIGLLAEACLKVESSPFRKRLSPAVAEMFDTLGRYSTWVYRLIFANLWLFSGVLDLICQKKGGELNALLRTTVAWTQASGSKQTNVMPARATMNANLRLMTGDAVESVLDYLARTIDNPDLKLQAVSSHEPSAISETGDCSSWLKVKRSVQAVWPEAIISPYLMIACSDARHYCRISDHVYRFSAMTMSGEHRKTIHGNNERIPLDTIGQPVAFYLHLMRQC